MSTNESMKENMQEENHEEQTGKKDVNQIEEDKSSNRNDSATSGDVGKDDIMDVNVLKSRIGELEKELEKKSKQCDEYYELLQRKAAEFENYKKRTVREKTALCNDITCEVVNSFIPVVDNLERAFDILDKEEGGPLAEGIEMVFRQTKDVLDGLGVKEIEALGRKFDPELHDAVLHVEDEEHGESEIVEVFQKGYMLGKKVIRHSTVKVAN